MNDKSNTFLDSGKGTLSALDLSLCHPYLYLDFDRSVCEDFLDANDPLGLVRR